MSNKSFWNLEIEFDKFEETSMSDDNTAFIFYMDIFNKAPNERKIILHEATYITCEREQLEQAFYLSGYCPRESTFKENTFRKAGFGFHTSKLKSVRNDDTIYLTVELPKERKKVMITFKKADERWLRIDSEQVDIGQMEKNLLSKIERFEAMEERCGISIEALYPILELPNQDGKYSIELNGEVHAINGTTVDKNIWITATLYDDTGRVIESADRWISSDSFFGLCQIQFPFSTYEVPCKIRIHPRIQ